MRKFVSAILALLFVGILGSSSSAQQEDKDAGAPVETSHTLQPPSGRCPSDMVEVEGDYCPDLDVRCLYNVDVNGNIQRDKKSGRVMQDLTWACGEYKNPTVCKSAQTVHLHFCIDRFEWPNKEGQIPQDWMTWFDAKKTVESVGKRLCTHREWTLAAEGPNAHPVPYGDGYHRDSTACNFDRNRRYADVTETDEFKALGLKGIDPKQSVTPNDAMSKALRMFLVPSGSKPNCVSDYGVHDMSGNIDEWVVNESSNDLCVNKSSGNCRSGLMGGHVWHVRNASRPMTTAHGAAFGWYETGTRACKDIQ
jgi:formylglycine-generating enzyme